MSKVSALPNLSKNGEKYGLVFGLCFAVIMVVLIPLMIMDKGLFIYFGDFVSQQLMFYYHSNEVVHNGGLLGWDWGTDLGSSFIGSYAFYLVGSPFFWLSCILPKKAVLYAIPWLLALKHAVAGVTSYAFIRRFVQNKNAAVIGALLYSFSGFQIYNIFFNHFQDVTAFFPLMLIAMEECVNNNRRGWFAASVALMGIINYFFFTGQVVFLVLYFFVRVNCRDFRVDMKKLAALAMEAVIGVAIAAVILAPAAMAILANSRVNQMLFGKDMVLYGDKTRIVRIIQSFFVIPDAPSRPNLFDSEWGKWSSIGGYLPLFSMAGVITFMKHKKNHWATLLIWICILCAMIPFLNSAFYMFNGSYYARWFYMPILIMALMTSQALDDKNMKWRTGVFVSVYALAILLVISFLPTKNNGKTEYFKFASNFPYFLIGMGVTLLCWLGLYYLYQRRKAGKPILQRAVWLTTAASVACTMTMVYFGKYVGRDGKEYFEKGLDGIGTIGISYENDDDDYFRLDISKNRDNYPMFWSLSCMRCFQSVVDPAIMDFYSSIGITRDVASRPETTSYTLRGLFSVKYYFDEIKEGMKELDLPGFVYDHDEVGYKVYRNEYFLPMGFTYDYYALDEDITEEKNEVKERMLIKALVLNEEQAEKYSDILTDCAGDYPDTKDEYLEECEKHQAEACEGFEYDSRHFATKITLEEPKLVFFSVPYESGWTATVNGQPVDIERVSYGFMAIRCEAGENAIRFDYEVPGLRMGFFITLGGIALLVLYLLFSKPLFSKKYGTQTHSYGYEPVSGVRAAKAYTSYLSSTFQPKAETSEVPAEDPGKEETDAASE